MRSNKRIKYHCESEESSFYNKLSAMLSISLFALTLLSALLLSSPSVSADTSATNDVEITVPISCNLASSTTTAHTATIDAGTYRNDIGESTITATCNDAGGFAIYAIGYSNDTHGNNTLINTTNENQTIASGTATSGATSNWAMKLTAVTGTYEPTIESAFQNYTTIPTVYTKVASHDSTTDQTTGAQLKSTYAAYIAPTQYAGTYEGKVKYTLVNPSDATTPQIPPVTIATATSMQEVNSCPADLPEEQVYTLIDSRDNQVYKVAKLKDGNCWMLDNLALDPTDVTTAANMNATNTNASTEAITNYLNGGSTNPGWSNVAVADVDSGFNSYTTPMINNASKNSLVTSYGLASVNGQANVGVYYNYCAATVGTYCYDRYELVDTPDSLFDISNDVCPAHWRMPTGTSGGEYFKLYSNIYRFAPATNSASLQYNLSTPLSGYFWGDSPYGQESMGFWWTSTYMNSGLMYGLYITSQGVDPAYDSIDGYALPNYDGASIRCIFGD